MAGRSLSHREHARVRRASRRAVGAAISVILRALYRIEVRGLENFTRAPSTLVVANHRRDSDGPIIGSVLMRRQGTLPNFVAREDLFQRGFLRDYLERWPAPIRALLAPVNLAPLLRYCGAYPMRRIPEQTLGEVLATVQDLFGDMPLDQVLKPSWIARFRSMAPRTLEPLRLRDVLTGRFRPLLATPAGLTKLTRRRFVAVKSYERAVIRDQLQWFAELLERGETLQLEPEGVVSPDGNIARPRAGLHMLLNAARAPTRVLPVGITYDFMATGRVTAFVNIGPEILGLKGLDRRTTDALVLEAILAQSTVTTSQLATELLRAARMRNAALGIADLTSYVAAQAQRCVAAGVRVDPRLIDSRWREARIRDYVAYCLAAGMLTAVDGDAFHVNSGGYSPASWSNPGGVIDYVHNEVASAARVWPVLGDMPHA